ncbi:MAG: DHH family phosphoesterase [Promethearchaeota archaeon]
MTTIFTHLDGDGVCCAALIKMIPKYHDSYVYFTHPAGLKHDLSSISGDDIIICDIAVDSRSAQSIYRLLDQRSQDYSVVYIDHHIHPDGMPSKVRNIHDLNVSATELVYRFFYDQLPSWADHIALLGAICDYLDDSPLMQRLVHHYERRTLFLDAGFLAQGLKKLGRRGHYEKLRNLVQQFSIGKVPSEIKELTQAAITATKADNAKRQKILEQYVSENNIAWIQDPPSMSHSKIAHWILGNSGKHIGLVIRTLNSKRQLVDITIRGWRKLDLRTFIPAIAIKMGGSAGGHANAVGCRIPEKNLKVFLRVLDSHEVFNDIEPVPSVAQLIPLEPN